MTTASLSLRITLSDGTRIGPGKADLLNHIAETGSIAAAGRAMGMSYKRAWALVETLNTAFKTPLVHSSRGGAKGGGAELTELGRQILAVYRRIETNATGATIADLEILQSHLKVQDG